MVNLLSPRIEELYNKLSCGTLVLGEFWKEVEREGTPLIEEVQGEEKVIITFLYRGNEGVNNVLIYGGVPGYRYSENIMERLEDTDIWFKSYIVRNDVKFEYNFSLNYEFHNDYKKIKKNSIIDSLNPKRVINMNDEENPESVETVYSLVELPKVKPDIWTIPNKQVEKGNIKLSRFESKIMGNTRRIWVYTPNEYDEKASPYNLLVLTDGFDYLNYLSANVVLDNLIHEKRIPPTVCILVDSSKNRYEELTCNEYFMKFITEEVMPWGYENYNITREPEKTIIGGLSLGGLTASYIALKRWDIFGKVLSQSGSYWYESQWITKEFEKEQKLPIRFYLNAGLLEEAPYDDEPVMMEVINNMRDVLLSKSYDVKYENFQSGHDYLCWGETLATGLISLNEE